MVNPRIPVSTYRLQFNGEFGFENARSIVSYLHKLGISDIYASPILRSRSGSSHGYDVADPTLLNPELGTDSIFDSFSRELKARQMGLLLDIVPNHMAASVQNPWWLDVLEYGPSSRYAAFFDIDWTSHSTQKGKLLLPILGNPYGEVLEGQELKLSLENDGLFVRYYDTRLPVNIEGCAFVLSYQLDALQSKIGASNPNFMRLSQIIESIDGLAHDEATDRLRSLKDELFQLINQSTKVREHVAQNIDAFNGSNGVPESFGLLDNLLSKQFYRLAFWRLASEQINYRRFFDIGDLAGIRVEDPSVFEAAHSLVMRLIKEGGVTGLRLDHIDGLYDPLEYLQRLQSRIECETTNNSNSMQFYVVAEKILVGNETLRENWPIAGTTGYDFLNALNGLFVDSDGIEHMKSAYGRFVGAETSFEQLVSEKKRQVILDLFSSELESLSERLATLASHDLHGRDIALSSLKSALVEITACLPVYRTYMNGGQLANLDRAVLENAFREAWRNTQLDERAISFIQRLLLLDFPDPIDAERKNEWLEFVMRWQQFTGPVTAKGVEDTALYNYNCLVSLNDVGGEPDSKAFGVDAFHEFNKARQAHWPHTMNATSTHDTKRSEDVRARINVLSEIPQEWERRALRWNRWNEEKKIASGGELLPDQNTEWLIYQTMLGAWPLRDGEIPEFKERLKAYVIKASREAKTLTSWLSPNEENEAALTQFVETILEQSPPNWFLPDFQAFQKRVSFYGCVNSLSQVLFKAVSPGLPDFYQGTELWDFSLVDPDNRRPVDFDMRQELLDDLIERGHSEIASLLDDLLTSWEDGRIKLYVTHKALGVRNEYRNVFDSGDYIPLKAKGANANHACAFARRHGDSWIIAAAPRLVTKLSEEGRFPIGSEVWSDDAIVIPHEAPKTCLNLLTNENIYLNSANNSIRLADIFSQLPVALLLVKTT